MKRSGLEARIPEQVTPVSKTPRRIYRHLHIRMQRARLSVLKRTFHRTLTFRRKLNLWSNVLRTPIISRLSNFVPVAGLFSSFRPSYFRVPEDSSILASQKMQEIFKIQNFEKHSFGEISELIQKFNPKIQSKNSIIECGP